LMSSVFHSVSVFENNTNFDEDSVYLNLRSGMAKIGLNLNDTDMLTSNLFDVLASELVAINTAADADGLTVEVCNYLMENRDLYTHKFQEVKSEKDVNHIILRAIAMALSCTLVLLTGDGDTVVFEPKESRLVIMLCYFGNNLVITIKDLCDNYSTVLKNQLLIVQRELINDDLNASGATNMTETDDPQTKESNVTRTDSKEHNPFNEESTVDVSADSSVTTGDSKALSDNSGTNSADEPGVVTDGNSVDVSEGTSNKTEGERSDSDNHAKEQNKVESSTCSSVDESHEHSLSYYAANCQSLDF